jgi:hypothetical protein
MCKTKTLFRQIVGKYHPAFANDNIAEQVKQHPKIFNIEHLIELTMAHVGGYKFVDADHCDFSDGSECKTASVYPSPLKKGGNSYRVEISNVVSSGGRIKSGDIRFVLYNPHNNSVSYYFVPQDKIQSLGINYHPTTGIGRVFATWHKITNRINKLDSYRVDSFEDLAVA